MSDFGLFLLMFAAVLVLVGAIKVLSLFSQWLDRPKIIPASAAPLVKRFAGKYVELRPVMATESEPGEEEEQDADSPATSQQNSNNGIAMQQGDSNALLLQAKAEALAALVKAGKIGETEGIKIVYGLTASSTNPKYQAARAALKEELQKLDQPRYRRTPEQEQLRRDLGIAKQ